MLLLFFCILCFKKTNMITVRILESGTTEKLEAMVNQYIKNTYHLNKKYDFKYSCSCCLQDGIVIDTFTVLITVITSTLEE